MHKTTLKFLFCFLWPITGWGQPIEGPFEYPATRQVDHTDTYFGTRVPDPYHWLEDDNSAATAAWVESQNKLTGDYLEKIPFREKLRDRLAALWNYPRESAPYRSGDYYFMSKNDGVQNQDVMYYTGLSATGFKQFIDPNTFSDDGTISLGGSALSHDSRYFAYGISRGGSDWIQICVRDMKTGKTFADTLSWVKFSGIAWYKNGFYYGGYDNPGPGEELKKKNEYHKIYYHQVGLPQAMDRTVFGDNEHPFRNFGATTSDDERYVIVGGYESTSGNEVFMKDLNNPSGGFIQLVEGFGSDYDFIDNEGSNLLFLTNHEAPRGRVVSFDAKIASPKKWDVVIPEHETAVLQQVVVAGNMLVALYLKDAVNFLAFYSREGKLLHLYEPAMPATIGQVNGHRKDSLLFFSETSFIHPTIVYKYNLGSRKKQIVFKPKIAFDFDRYESKQEWYESKDGTRIPVFIVHRKGIELNGNNPTLLYGYGGFNISIRPTFSPWRLAFLEAGGVYASANIRGGGEYGETWHRAGTRLQKQNVFDDFIAAAEYLIAKKYTSSEKLAIHGRSNGGLLVGACMTQRPDLFKVALPGVGVLDMLRFHKFTIGWAWTADYGSSDDEAEFKALYAYSPLHNIKKGVKYPATLVTTADHDDRVVPAHSFKFISTLQEKSDPSSAAFIRVDVKAGHGAGKPVSKQIDEWTDILSFMMVNLGVKYGQ